MADRDKWVEKPVPERSGPKGRQPIRPNGAASEASLLDLQRKIGNAGVVALLAGEQAGADIHRYPVPGRPALYIDNRRHPELRRKVNNLPAHSFHSSGVMGSIKSKLGEKSEKQKAFEAIQAEVARYNEEKSSTAEDLARQQAKLAVISRMVQEWVETHGKEGGDLAHKKQSYMSFTLPQALTSELKANAELKPAAPKGAQGGVAMPGMSPSPRPRLPPPLPPPLPSAPPPRPEGQVREESKDPAPRERRLPPPLPAHVPGRVPAPEEYTDFQRRIADAHERLANLSDDDDATMASRAFVNELYANIGRFSQSILAAGVDEKGKPIPGTGIRDKNKLDAILVAIDGNKDAVYGLLGIAPPDAKELGLEGLDERVRAANEAIRVLGPISPAIAQRFQAAATTTNRIATAKGLTGLAVGVGVGFAPVPGLGAAFSAAQAIKKVQSTVKHLRRLKRIKVIALSKGNADMVDLLDYIIAKKESKKIKSGVGGVPLLSTASTAVFKMKGLWKMAKGTRGEGRKAAGAELIDSANKGDAEAQMVIMELVDDLEEYKQVLLGGPAGAEIIANKMKSA